MFIGTGRLILTNLGKMPLLNLHTAILKHSSSGHLDYVLGAENQSQLSYFRAEVKGGEDGIILYSPEGIQCDYGIDRDT